MKPCHTLLVLVLSASALPAAAQTDAMCANLSDATRWQKDHDAVLAAPLNHKVIYESADLRVLEVTVLPGERELVHHHQWPSVMVLDSRPKYLNYDNRGQEIKPFVPPPANPDMPIMVRLPAQEEHAIHNIGDKPFHAIRIEYKTLCPSQR